MTLSSVNLDFSCKLDISAFLRTAFTVSYVLTKDHILFSDRDITVLDVLLLLHLPPLEISDGQDDHHEDTGDDTEDSTSSHDDRKDD